MYEKDTSKIAKFESENKKRLADEGNSSKEFHDTSEDGNSSIRFDPDNTHTEEE